LDGLKTLAWVCPLTLLIWVYAEREQISEPTYGDVAVHFNSNSLWINPDVYKVALELKGPQNGLDRVREALASNIPSGLQIDLGSSLPVGRQRISIFDNVQNLKLFRDTGVSVTKTTPMEIDVDVDNLVDWDVPVQSPPGYSTLESTTHFEPRTLKAHGPESVLRGLRNQGLLIAYPNLDPAATLKPGHRDDVVGASLAAKDPHITLQPATVRAILDVRASDETMPIAAIPISISAPQNVISDYEIQNLAPSITDVKVSGPPKQLELLKQSLPAVFLSITSDDIGREQPKRLRFDLPEGVTISPEDQAKTFTFKLVRRQKSE